MQNPDGTFHCPGCGEDKPLDAKHFYHNSAMANGFDCRCKVCRNATTYEYRRTAAGQEARLRTNRESDRKREGAKKIKAYVPIAGIMHKHADEVLRELGLK